MLYSGFGMSMAVPLNLFLPMGLLSYSSSCLLCWGSIIGWWSNYCSAVSYRLNLKRNEDLKGKRCQTAIYEIKNCVFKVLYLSPQRAILSWPETGNTGIVNTDYASIAGLMNWPSAACFCVHSENWTARAWQHLRTNTYTEGHEHLTLLSCYLQEVIFGCAGFTACCSCLCWWTEVNVLLCNFEFTVVYWGVYIFPLDSWAGSRLSNTSKEWNVMECCGLDLIGLGEGPTASQVGIKEL